MVYLLITLAVLGGVWLVLKKRRLVAYVMDCRDQSYREVFEAQTPMSQRGRLAEEMRRANPAIAKDREYFIKLCRDSGVEPGLAAQAWIDRALSARFQHKPH